LTFQSDPDALQSQALLMARLYDLDVLPTLREMRQTWSGGEITPWTSALASRQDGEIAWFWPEPNPPSEPPMAYRFAFPSSRTRLSPLPR
jgi:hypothetical protein